MTREDANYFKVVSNEYRRLHVGKIYTREHIGKMLERFPKDFEPVDSPPTYTEMIQFIEILDINPVLSNLIGCSDMLKRLIDWEFQTLPPTIKK